jgi:peptidyl-prolyl cis-trans isomerase A (cyclophilin A)
MAPVEPAPLDDTLGIDEVLFSTSAGDIRIQLDAASAPVTSTNFLDYVDAGFYDGADGDGATVFHRIVPGFVVQGGGLTASLARKATAPSIVNESDNGLLNTRGTLSMARLSAENSATSQFFINLVDNPFLDASLGTSNGYAVFAEVVDGMDVVDAMATVATGSQGMLDDVPLEPIEVLDVTRGPRSDAP